MILWRKHIALLFFSLLCVSLALLVDKHTFKDANLPAYRGSVKIYNPELNADNVFEIDIDPVILQNLSSHFYTHVAPHLKRFKPNARDYQLGNKESNQHFNVATVKKWFSDIRWVSTNNVETYNYYIQFVEKLGVKDILRTILDVDDDVNINQIFFVLRSVCEDYYFHNDYRHGSNVNGLSINIPLDDLHVGLAYKDRKDLTQMYNYRKNTGIAFGENFFHSTARGIARKDEVMLAISTASDKVEYWDSTVFWSINNQGLHLHHPKLGYIRVRDDPNFVREDPSSNPNPYSQLQLDGEEEISEEEKGEETSEEESEPDDVLSMAERKEEL